MAIKCLFRSPGNDPNRMYAEPTLFYFSEYSTEAYRESYVVGVGVMTPWNSGFQAAYTSISVLTSSIYPLLVTGSLQPTSASEPLNGLGGGAVFGRRNLSGGHLELGHALIFKSPGGLGPLSWHGSPELSWTL